MKKPPNMSDEDFGRFLADCAMGPLSSPIEFDRATVLILVTGAVAIFFIVALHFLGVLQ